MTRDGNIFFEVSLSIAAACLAPGFWVRLKENATRQWPQASGRIVSSKTHREYAGRGIEEELPDIEYEFEYYGRLFKSAHWRVGNYSIGNTEAAQAVISRYPVGTVVTVFVNPREPMKSVLEHGVSPLSWIPIGFGVGFIGLSLLPLLL